MGTASGFVCARRSIRCVRGVGRAFLYLSIYYYVVWETALEAVQAALRAVVSVIFVLFNAVVRLATAV